ncbi:protein VACUOLELESS GAMETOPHYTES-like [Curcuma longa]|uniref:protein VACUOLELESS GAMETOPHYTES-like n=1 Tax=Curcuma longa TaxID=136217 RepID=UPI003D9F4BBC
MANEDGISHYLHPQHRLAHVHIEGNFLCDGCKVVGHGVRFRCHACNFDLHEHCARCSSTISVPMHSDHLLTLHVLSQDNPRRCDVCRKTAIGLCYRCVPCGVDIHPLCTLVRPNGGSWVTVGKIVLKVINIAANIAGFPGLDLIADAIER